MKRILMMVLVSSKNRPETRTEQRERELVLDCHTASRYFVSNISVLPQKITMSDSKIDRTKVCAP